jgi:hypothetical protein
MQQRALGLHQRDATLGRTGLQPELTRGMRAAAAATSESGGTCCPNPAATLTLTRGRASGSAPSSLQRARPLSSCASVTASAPLYARKNLNEFTPAAASAPMSAATCAARPRPSARPLRQSGRLETRVAECLGDVSVRCAYSLCNHVTSEYRFADGMRRWHLRPAHLCA